MVTRLRSVRPGGRRPFRIPLHVEPLEGRSLPSAAAWPGLACPLAAVEPDDTFDAAADLGALSAPGRVEAVGNLGDGFAGPGDVDAFRFTLTQPAAVTLTTLDRAGGSPLVSTLRLYSNDVRDAGNPQSWVDHRLLAQDDGLPRGGDAWLLRDLGPGSYSLTVSGSAGTTGDYGLLVTAAPLPFLRATSPMPVETLDRALDLGGLSGVGQAEVAGRLGDGPSGAADVDWVRFTLDRPATVTLTTQDRASGSSLSAVVGLYNSDPGHFGDPLNPSDHRLLAQDDSLLDGGDAHSMRDLAPGTYFVAVSGSGNRFFHPLLAGSGSPGSTGRYDLLLTATDLPLSAGGPVVVSAEPADAASLAGSPLVLRVALSADLDPATLAPGQSVVLEYSPDPTFDDGNDATLPIANVNFTGNAKELQITPNAPLDVGYYRLTLAGDAASHDVVLRGLDGTSLGMSDAAPDGTDFVTTFRVAGAEGRTGSAADDTAATAHDLGGLAPGKLVQATGTIGDDPAYTKAGSQEVLDDPTGPAALLANPAADVDLYSFDVSGPGRHAIILQADAGRIGSGLDPALTLFRVDPTDGHLAVVTFNNNTGNTTAATDGSQPLFQDAVLYTSLTEGTYYVAVSSGPNLPDPGPNAVAGVGGVFDPAVSHSGTRGNSRGDYLLSLLVTTDDTPLEVRDVAGLGETAPPPTGFTVRFSGSINLQLLQSLQKDQTQATEVSAIYLLGSDGVETYPRMTSYDSATGLASFLVLDALPNGPASLHLSGARGLADLAANPLVGNDPSGDYVVPFVVAGPPRGTAGNPLLWTDAEPNNTAGAPQNLGVLFPRDLNKKVTLTRDFATTPSTNAADGADVYRFEVIQTRGYFVTVSGTNLPPGTRLTAQLLFPDGRPRGAAFNRISQPTLAAGTYLLRVTGWPAGATARGQYQVKLSLGTSAEAPIPLTTSPAPAYRIRLADAPAPTPSPAPSPTGGGATPPSSTPSVSLPSAGDGGTRTVVPATTSAGALSLPGLPSNVLSAFSAPSVGGVTTPSPTTTLAPVAERLSLPGLDGTAAGDVRGAVFEAGAASGDGQREGGRAEVLSERLARALADSSGTGLDERQRRAVLEWVTYLLSGLWSPFTLPDVPSEVPAPKPAEETEDEEAFFAPRASESSSDWMWASGLLGAGALALLREPRPASRPILVKGPPA